jgi:flagellar assembly protein FliH
MILRGAASSTLPTLRPRRLGAATNAEDEDKLRAEAIERGFVEGQALALERAAREREREHEQAQAALHHALEALTLAIERAEQAWEIECRRLQSEATSLAFAVLEQMFGRELELAREPGREALERALRILKDAPATTVRLNPRDFATIDAALDRLSFRLVPDETIAAGGALVEAGDVVIDARVDRALERVRVALGLVGEQR